MLYEATELDAAALRHSGFYQYKLKTLQTEYEEAPQSAIKKLRKALPQIQQAHTWLYNRINVDAIHTDLLIDITTAATGHLRMVIAPDEWQRWLEHGIDAAVVADRAIDQLNFWSELGIHTFRQGNLDEAEKIVITALELAETPPHRAQLYYLRALVYQKQGHAEAAMQAVEQAQYHYETAQDTNGIGKVRSFMAQAAIDALEYDKARTLLEENIELWKQQGNQNQMAVEQYQLGVLLANRVLLDEANIYLIQAREMFQRLSDRRYEALTLLTLGSNYTEIGQYEKALEYLQQALELSRQVNEQRGMAGTLNHIGSVYELKEEFATALDYHQQAVDVAASINYHFHHADAHRSMCLIYLKLGNVESAGTHLYNALQVAPASGVKLVILAVLCAAVGVLNMDDRPLLAAQLVQAIQYTTNEPLILKLLEPHLADTIDVSGDAITIDEAVELIKHLYQ